MSIEAAFDMICQQAKPTGQYYVSLLVEQQYYGGPEEGGWWGTDMGVIKYQVFSTEEAANAAADAIRKLAVELTREALVSHGKHCSRSMDWLEARGLDADFLPEVAEADKYHVMVGDEPPESSRGCRHYD